MARWTSISLVIVIILSSSYVHGSTKQELADGLFEDYWSWRLFSNPIMAVYLDLHQSIYRSRLPAFSDQEIKTRKEVCLRFLQRSKNIQKTEEGEGERDRWKKPEEPLPWQTRLSLMILDREIQDYLDGLEFKAYYMPKLSRGTDILLQILAGRPLQSEKDYDNMFTSLGRYPKVVDQIISLMQKGIQYKMTATEVEVNMSLANIKRFLKDDRGYKLVFDFVSPKIPSHKRGEISQRGRTYLDTIVYPSLKTLGQFIEDVYLKHARKNVSLSSLPNGLAHYKQLIKFFIGTRMTPAEVHEKGRSKLSAIQEEITKIAKELGYTEDSMPDIGMKIRNDSMFYYKSPDEVKKHYMDILHNKIQPQLHKDFNNFPEEIPLNFVSRGHGQAQYATSSSPLSDEPGMLVVPTNQRMKHLSTALCLHEAKPGHQLQEFTLQNNTALPKFRRFPFQYSEPPSSFSLYDGYVEGWATYAETLGIEMEVYDDVTQRYGYLYFRLSSALHLLVDTGIHFYGWSIDKATQFIVNSSTLTKEQAQLLVGRYILRPGEAVAYQIGSEIVQKLRKQAEEALGKKFDIKNFHGYILNCQAPLDIVEECVHAYIEETFAS